jgi:glycosyltransferase involved in cell wall biosynthesis
MGETWGLAVNEAMNFEKPVIVSDTCGCSVDLVHEGVNGYTFPEGDTGMLTQRIRQVAERPEVCEGMGKASLKIVRDYSIGVIVNNIQDANDE